MSIEPHPLAFTILKYMTTVTSQSTDDVHALESVAQDHHLHKYT